jgi:hypothetical protein
MAADRVVNAYLKLLRNHVDAAREAFMAGDDDAVNWIMLKLTQDAKVLGEALSQSG